MKKTFLYSFLFLKSPQRIQAEFLDEHPYSLSNMNKVKEKFLKRGLNYWIEPAFYIMAMYVLLGVGVIGVFAVFVLTCSTGMENIH